MLRQAIRNAVALLSVVAEPVRARVRDRVLARAVSTKAEVLAVDVPPIVCLLVYRKRNVSFVQLLLRQLGSSADVRLWALDEIAPELATNTVGCGRGVRFAHLNSLYAARPIPEGSWLVVADDDFVFLRGDLLKIIDHMKTAGFSLAQPGQSLLGWWTSLFNVARPFLVARDTNFVEQGPLLIADPVFSKLILPLPVSNDMGWGIEAEWYRLKEGRFRIGVIDDCRIVHWSKNAHSYPAGPEMERMHERLSAAGVESIWQLQRVNGNWWKWQRSPTWIEA